MDKKRQPTDGIGCLWIFYIMIETRLLNAVYSFGQTRNFAGSIVLVIYTLGSSFVNNRSCVQESSFCSLSVFCNNSGVHFLDSGFHTGFDSFVALILVLFTRILFFADLMLANPYTSKYFQSFCLFAFHRAWTLTRRRTARWNILL